MRKGKFPIVLILGIALIAISLLMVAILQLRNHIGAKNIQTTLTQMEQLLPEGSGGVPGAYPNANMPVLQIEGADYVALLEIPSMQISLPVADKWDGNKLFNAPARFTGSAYDHTLVIGGTDASYQFGFCDEIDNGTRITVTDMTGAQFTYEVASVDRAKKAESAWLADPQYQLTLYCRDTYSMEYIAVRCNFVYN